MKKYIISSVIVILIIILSTPWFMGYQAKKLYLSLIQEKNNLYNNQLKIEVTSYKLGWLHSSATYNITVIPDPSIPPMSVLQGQSQISHGPIVYDRINKSVTFALASLQDKASVLFAPINGNTPLAIISADTVMHFGNKVSNVFQFDNVMIPGITWLGFNGTSNISLKSGKVDSVSTKLQSTPFSATIPEQTIPTNTATQAQNQNSTLSIAPLTISTDIVNLTDSPTSTTAISLADVSMKRGNNPTMMAQGITIHSNASLKSNTYSSTVTAKLNKLFIANFVIPDINTVNVNFAVNNLDVSQQSSLAAQIKPIGTSLDIHVLRPDTTATFSLSLNSPHGALSLAANADWKGLTPSSKVTTGEQLLKATNATANLKLSIALAKKIAELVVSAAPDYVADLKQKATINNPELASNTDIKNQFDKAVALLVQQQQMQLPDAITVMNLHETNPSIEAFTTVVNGLQITEPTKKILIDTESKSLQMAEAAKETPWSTEQMIQLVISNWLENGYIIQKNDDYLSTITVNGGNVLVNGHDVTLH